MPRGYRTLVALFTVAFVVSVIHYLDNYVNYADFPQPTDGSVLALITQWVVAAGWFAFTAAGLAGLWLYAQGRIVPAALCLAAYSGSGLVGIGHYLIPGASSMPWWRHAHVIADIACGVLVFGFAVWAVLAVGRSAQAGELAR